jgi:hypothetical protein
MKKYYSYYFIALYGHKTLILIGFVISFILAICASPLFWLSTILFIVPVPIIIYVAYAIFSGELDDEIINCIAAYKNRSTRHLVALIYEKLYLIKHNIGFLETEAKYIAQIPEYREIIKNKSGDVGQIYDCLRNYYDNQLSVGQINAVNAYRNDFELIDKNNISDSWELLSTIGEHLKDRKSELVSLNKLDKKSLRLINNLSEFDVVGTVKVIRSIKEKELDILKR